MFYSKEQNKINKRKKKSQKKKTQKKDDKNTKNDEEEEDKNDGLLDESVQVKICDFGNGCWIDHHFTNTIQTRQYRSPEIILGSEYDETCDLWSYACMVFELVTGDYLFNPKSSDTCTKEEDHIAYIIELIGYPDLKWLQSGKRYRKYFTTKGRMKKVYKHKIWRLEEVLRDKYCFKKEEAKQLADFLMQALQWRNEDRKSAQEMLKHPWLSMPADYDARLNSDDEEEDDGEGEEDDADTSKNQDTPAKTTTTNNDDESDGWVTLDSEDEDAGSDSSEFEVLNHSDAK